MVDTLVGRNIAGPSGNIWCNMFADIPLADRTAAGTPARA